MSAKHLLSTFCVALLSAASLQAQSFQSELQAEIESSFEKLISLAEAVPEDQYDWRPVEGVRSFGEVFVHVSAAGFFFGNMGGVELPEGLDLQDAEQRLTEKSEILALMEQTRLHVVAGVGGLADDALENEVEWFGGSRRSARHVLIALAEHTSEHLGQLIAYARMNGIAPPWSGS